MRPGRTWQYASRSRLAPGNPGLIAITPVGLEYDRMAAGDIVVVDAEGRRVEGERQPSSETDVHLVVYRRGRGDLGPSPARRSLPRPAPVLGHAELHLPSAP